MNKFSLSILALSLSVSGLAMYKKSNFPNPKKIPLTSEMSKEDIESKIVELVQGGYTVVDLKSVSEAIKISYELLEDFQVLDNFSKNFTCGYVASLHNMCICKKLEHSLELPFDYPLKKYPLSLGNEQNFEMVKFPNISQAVNSLRNNSMLGRMFSFDQNCFDKNGIPHVGGLPCQIAKYIEGKLIKDDDFELIAAAIKLSIDNGNAVIATVFGENTNELHYFNIIGYSEEENVFIILDPAGNNVYTLSKEGLETTLSSVGDNNSNHPSVFLTGAGLKSFAPIIGRLFGMYVANEISNFDTENEGFKRYNLIIPGR